MSNEINIITDRGVDTLSIELIQEIEKRLRDAMVPMGFTQVSSTKSGDHVEFKFRQFGWCN